MARRFAKVLEEEIEEAFFYPSDLVNTKTTSRVSVHIHHYSPPLRGIVVLYIIQLFCHSASQPARHAVNVQTSQSLEQPFVFRKCEKKSTSNIKSNMFLTYHAVNQVDRSQGFKGSMILWRQKQ